MHKSMYMQKSMQMCRQKSRNLGRMSIRNPEQSIYFCFSLRDSSWNQELGLGVAASKLLSAELLGVVGAVNLYKCIFFRKLLYEVHLNLLYSSSLQLFILHGSLQTGAVETASSKFECIVAAVDGCSLIEFYISNFQDYLQVYLKFGWNFKQTSRTILPVWLNFD